MWWPLPGSPRVARLRRIRPRRPGDDFDDTVWMPRDRVDPRSDQERGEVGVVAWGLPPQMPTVMLCACAVAMTSLVTSGNRRIRGSPALMAAPSVDSGGACPDSRASGRADGPQAGGRSALPWIGHLKHGGHSRTGASSWTPSGFDARHAALVCTCPSPPSCSPKCHGTGGPGAGWPLGVRPAAAAAPCRSTTASWLTSAAAAAGWLRTSLLGPNIRLARAAPDPPPRCGHP